MKRSREMSLMAILIAAVVSTAGGATITVTTTSDVVDINWQTATVTDLPGPDGVVSFSEAMIASNNTAGHDTVAFAIPASQLGWCCPQYDGIAVFHSVTGFYWRANDEVTIDGTSQTAFAGDTNPDGAEVLLYSKTLYLNAGNSTLLGFHGTAIQSGGTNGLIEGNTGGVNLTLFGGGGSTVRNNQCGTIKIDRSSNNVVIGNTTQRVRVLGFGSGQLATGNRIGGPNPGDRNYITGYGTWNGEGLPGGTTVQIFASSGTVIENNWIGTTPDGLSQGSLASVVGIGFEGENHDTVIRNNRIAGILGHGMGPHHAGQLFGWAILIAGTGSNVLVVGNTIGLDANDEPTLGSVWGIDIGNPVTNPAMIDGIFIGGSQPGEGNVVAGHLLNGITVGRSVAQVRVSNTAIHSNGWLGIDLIPTEYGYGVTPNDAGDDDTGGNSLQNFPVLSKASSQGATTLVAGNLNSTPNTTFDLEFFANDACDPSGNGEGQIVLGGGAVTTDASGNAAFQFTLPAASAVGQFMTATATDTVAMTTSEFSACLAIVEGQIAAGDIDGDGDLDMDDQVLLIDVLLGDDPGTIRADRCDLNNDGFVDGLDVAPFVALMLGW